MGKKRHAAGDRIGKGKLSLLAEDIYSCDGGRFGAFEEDSETITLSHRGLPKKAKYKLGQHEDDYCLGRHDQASLRLP